MQKVNLVKTPETIVDYVIIHELCHLRIEGHSHHFWSLLHKFVPDYQKKLTGFIEIMKV